MAPTFVHAEGAALTAVAAFRRRTYAQRSSIRLADELHVDRRAHVFALRDRSQVLACARALPLPDPDAGILGLDGGEAAARCADVEVGRLAVARGRSPLLLLHLLGSGARWMEDHTPHRTFVAYCSPRLVPLYERVGASDVGIDATSLTSGRAYRIVVGRFATVAQEALRAVTEATAA